VVIFCPFKEGCETVGISLALITLVPRLVVIVSFLGSFELTFLKIKPCAFMVDVPRLLVIVTMV